MKQEKFNLRKLGLKQLDLWSSLQFTEIDLYVSIDYSNNKFKFINIYGETCGITLSFTTQNGKGMSIPIFKEVYFDNKKEDWVIKK